MSRLKEQYQNEIVDALIKKFGYKNIMEVPKLDKVVILSLIHIYSFRLHGQQVQAGASLLHMRTT